MKAAIDFDATRGYGAATSAIQRIVSEWSAVDWFAPVDDATAEMRAQQMFLEHDFLARQCAPGLYAVPTNIRTELGGWTEFASLCDRVRAPTSSFDWKHSVLKKLCFHHSNACGWSLQAQVKHRTSLAQGASPRSGDLFFGFGDQVMWTFTPKLDIEAAVLESRVPASERRRFVDVADWYVNYANMDVTHCIEWQLAEDSARLEGNPFVPLMRCFTEGFLPFSMGPGDFVLFAFAPALSS